MLLFILERWVFNWPIDIFISFLFCGILWLITYIAVYTLIKHVIKNGITNIYKTSKLFQNSNIEKEELIGDIDTFFNKVKLVIDKKHQEIEKLNTRDNFRRDFLGNVSHELKTPLFTAQGYILTLLDDEFDNTQLRKKYLERANKSIERLDFIVKDLDLISKLESGMQLKYESFNIIKLINGVFDMLELKARKRNIVMTFDDTYEFPLLVRADIERIEQVLINLIANSINYGKDNGITSVGIQSYSKTQFMVSISDNGLGISEENIPRLFERFYRVDHSRSRDQGGSGLGLAIVKHIVEAHHQKIKVESNPGQGSTFSFTIQKVL